MGDNFDDGAPNLYEIERGLRDLESSGGKAALELKQCRFAVAHAKQKLRLAKVRAFAEYKGMGGKQTVQERELHIVERTDTEQFELDIAEAALMYARDLVDDRQGQRSSLQTRAKLSLEALRLSGYASESQPKWRSESMRG